MAEPFQYVVLRVVPRIERGECINAGVVLYCRTGKYLAARTSLPVDKLEAIAPEADQQAIAQRLRVAEHIAGGDERGGALATYDMQDRFGWLAAPASTIVQPGPIHTGLCEDPAATLDKLFTELVA